MIIPCTFDVCSDGLLMGIAEDLCLSGDSGLKTWLSTGSGDTSVPSACVTYLKG